MAVPKLKYASGNSASTTLSSGYSSSSTSAPLNSDTNFDAKSGEGQVVISEGTEKEEFAYAESKSGGALTIPLVNRGLEGTSAQSHLSGATIKGILTSGMWNDLVDSLLNILDQTTGAIKSNLSFLGRTTMITRKETIYDNGDSGTSKEISWINGSTQKITLNNNCTLSFSNASSGDYLTLLIDINATGGYTLTLPANCIGETGVVITKTANAKNLVGFRYDGTNYRIVGSQQNLSTISSL